MVAEQGKDEGNWHREVSVYPENILSSVGLAVGRGLMNSFVLKGPIGERINVHLAVLLRIVPYTEQTEHLILADEKNGFSMGDVDQELASLEIPSHLRNGDSLLEDNAEFRRVSKILAEENTPLIMLGWGESDKTEQEMIGLFVVKGMSAERAIKALRMWTPLKENKQQG